MRNKHDTDEQLDKLWFGLSDIPFDEQDDEYVLSQDYHIWSKGTTKDEIWHWFDENYSKGLGERHFKVKQKQINYE